MIDTGATRTCVDEPILKNALALKPIGIVNSGTAGGSVQQALYPARLVFTEQKLDLEFSSVVGVDLSGQQLPDTAEHGKQDLIALVGRDILANCVLIYNGPGGFFTLSF